MEGARRRIDKEEEKERRNIREAERSEGEVEEKEGERVTKLEGKQKKEKRGRVKFTK